MFQISVLYLNDFIKILLSLYYYNFTICTKLIFITYKFLLLFKYLLSLSYYHKKLFLEKFLYTNNIFICKAQVSSHILNIKITAKTTKSTIVRKFYIISIFGNKTNWVGIGVGKHKKLITAVRDAYKNAFQNIIYFNKQYFNIKSFNLKFKNTRILVYRHNFINLQSKSLYNIFELLGFYLNSKIIGVSSNINNLLHIIKQLSNFNIS